MGSAELHSGFLLVTGPRTWWDMMRIEWELWDRFDKATWLVHGGCPGSPDVYADALWRRWGGKEPIVLPADWNGPCRSLCNHGNRPVRWGREYCPRAGYYRNEAMVDRLVDIRASSGVTVNVAQFLTPESKGAVHCGTYATTRGLTVDPIVSTSRPVLSRSPAL